MSTLRVSVVVPTYRRPVELARCLAGLARQTEAPCEVVVAVRTDDCETRALLAGWHSGALTVIEVPIESRNASDARNSALRRTTGDIIAMIDDDTVPRPSWLATLVAHFDRDPTLGGIGGPDWFDGVEVAPHLRPPVVGRVQWWGRRIGNHHLGATECVDVEWLKGANMSFRRGALCTVAFGHNLRGQGAQFAEDVALSLRVRHSGWRLRYDPALAVDHFHGKLVAGVDHRNLADEASLADAAHNETVAILEYLPPLRRAVFLAWATLVGTKLLPGAIAAGFHALHRRKGALARWLVVQRGRRAGWGTWRRARASGTSMARTPLLSAPLRICLVTHLVTRSDGQGRVNYELARYLARNGHQVTLVASDVHGELLEERGISWLRVPVPGKVPALLRWGLFALGARWRLRQPALRGFDIVHLNGAIAPVPAHINTSHFVHAGWQRASSAAPRHDRFGRIYQRIATEISRWSERRAYHGAGLVVAVSETVRDSLSDDVGLPPARVRVIHTGVDVDEFRPRRLGESRPVRDRLGLAADAFLLLFVGDAKSSRKNLDLPLRTLTHLDARFHLAIVGAAAGGPYAAMAERLGIAARTHFLGARQDVARCYRDADALICAAHYEPASLVLLEAMASALPVIATRDVGNATFIVNGENGFLLRSAGDADGAVGILRRLASDPLLCARVGKAARETVVALSWERMGSRYEELYAGLGRGAA